MAGMSDGLERKVIAAVEGNALPIDRQAALLVYPLDNLGNRRGRYGNGVITLEAEQYGNIGSMAYTGL
jgi:hypothetical protein